MYPSTSLLSAIFVSLVAYGALATPVKRNPGTDIVVVGPSGVPHPAPCTKLGLCPEVAREVVAREPQTEAEAPGKPPYKLPCKGDICPLVAGEAVPSNTPTPVVPAKREPFKLPPGGTPIPCNGSICSLIHEYRQVPTLAAREPYRLLPGESPPPCHGSACSKIIADRAVPTHSPTSVLLPKREPQVLLPGQTPHPHPCTSELCPVQLRAINDERAIIPTPPPLPKREPFKLPPGWSQIPCSGSACTVVHEYKARQTQGLGLKREPYRLLPGESPPPCKGSACSKLQEDREVHELPN